MAEKLALWEYALIVGVILVEAFTLSLFKSRKLWYVALFLYIIVGLGLSVLIRKRGLAVGHAVFDFMGILIITLIGLFYYKEKLSYKQIAGLVLGFIALYLIESDGGGHGHSHF